MDVLAQVRTIPDPVERVRAVNDAIKSGSTLLAELALIKRETVRQLVDKHGGAETGRMLGIGSSRVSQIVNGRRSE